MTGNTHVIVGYIAMACVIVTFGFDAVIYNNLSINTLIALTTVGIGALLPDIDIGRSKAGYKFKKLIIILKYSCLPLALYTAYTQNVVYLGILASILAFILFGSNLKHRGFTHTLVIPIALCASLFYVDLIVRSLIFGLLIGYVSHILLSDIFNKKGVPIFWPLSSKKCHLATFKSGTSEEIKYLILYSLICGSYIAWRCYLLV